MYSFSSSISGGTAGRHRRGSSSCLMVVLFLLFLAVVSTPVDANNDTMAPTVPGNTTNGTNTTAHVKAKMTANSWVTLATVVVVLAALTFDVVPVSAMMILCSVFLRLCSIIDTKDLLAGLSNPGVCTIALLYVVIGPITDLPVIRKVTAMAMSGRPGWARFKVCFLVMATSWFVNNTPLVAMLTPVIKSYCRQRNLSPSQFLMPMNFATLIGGSFAVIGTSTNLIYDGLMRDADLGPMPFFEMVKVSGIPGLIALIYFVFLPPLLLPTHKGGMFRLVREKGPSFVAQFFVEDSSPLVGMDVQSWDQLLPESVREHVELVELNRDGTTFRPRPTDTIEEGDHLFFAGQIETLRSSATLLRISWVPFHGDVSTMRNTSFSNPQFSDVLSDNASFFSDMRGSFAQGAAPRGSPSAVDHEPADFMEVVLSDKSPAVGKLIKSGAFQRFYQASIVATRSTDMSDADLVGAMLSNHKLAVGDTLLLLGSSRCLQQFPEHFYVASTLDDDSNIKKTVDKNYIVVPNWFPFGTTLGNEEKAKKKAMESMQAENEKSAQRKARKAESDEGQQTEMEGSGSGQVGTNEPIADTPTAPPSPSYAEEENNAAGTTAETEETNDHNSSRKSSSRSSQEIVVVVAKSDQQEEAKPATNGSHVNGNETTAADRTENEQKKEGGDDAKDEGDNDNEKGASDIKVIRIPDRFKYISLIIFTAMMATAASGVDIVLCALVASIVMVFMKLRTVNEAFKSIDIDVYAMVAFSFGLGAAMKKSGLAAVIADGLNDANLSGFPLLLVLGYICALITNTVTNKACAQVMFPIVVALYQRQGKDPVPVIVMLACCTSIALVTPYGFATSLIIMGPGGYRGKDFVKYGLPLNLLLILLFAVAASIVYDLW